MISHRTRMLWHGGVGWHEGNFMELPGLQKLWQVGTVTLYVSQYHFIASQKWLSSQWWWKVCWLGFFLKRNWMKDVATNAAVDEAICLCSSVFVRQWSCVQEVSCSIELSKLVSSLKKMRRLWCSRCFQRFSTCTSGKSVTEISNRRTSCFWLLPLYIWGEIAGYDWISTIV